MAHPDDLYAIGATYDGGDNKDNVALRRALYFSLFGEDFKAGQSRYSKLRMVIGNYSRDPEYTPNCINPF